MGAAAGAAAAAVQQPTGSSLEGSRFTWLQLPSMEAMGCAEPARCIISRTTA